MTAPTYTSTNTMPRNSASSSSQITALSKKHRTSSSAEYTGFRARMTPSAAAVAKLYGDLLDGYVMDIGDADEVAHVAPRVTLAPTLMTNLAEREELGRVVLEAASALASMKRGRDFIA